MPPKRKYNKYRKRTYKKKRRYKRKSKLMDKKINTQVERRMVQIAKKIAPKQFKNQIQTVFGDYHDNPQEPEMYGRVNQLLQLTLYPNIQKILVYDSGAQTAGRPQLVIPYISTTEVANNDPLQDRLNRRMSDKVYIKGFTLKGSFKLPVNCPQEIVQVNIVEVSTGANHQIDVDTEAEFDEKILLPSIPPITGFQRVSTQEQPLFRKTNRVILNKVYKLTNNESAVASKFVQYNIKHFFKKPKMVQYMESDISGLYPLNRFWYVSMRCSGKYDDVATTNDGYSVTPTSKSPEVIGTFKVFYHDKGS